MENKLNSNPNTLRCFTHGRLGFSLWEEETKCLAASTRAANEAATATRTCAAPYHTVWCLSDVLFWRTGMPRLIFAWCFESDIQESQELHFLSWNETSSHQQCPCGGEETELLDQTFFNSEEPPKTTPNWPEDRERDTYGCQLEPFLQTQLLLNGGHKFNLQWDRTKGPENDQAINQMKSLCFLSEKRKILDILNHQTFVSGTD